MDRPDTYTQWANERSAKAERIVAFRTWVYAQLGTHLRWPANEAQREREIGQAAHWVERMVCDLGAHGFLFRPKDIAEIITTKLKAVGHYQRTNSIDCVWSYLRRVWDGYVRIESERLRARAMDLGVHVQQLTANLAPPSGGDSAAPVAPSMPEILLEVQRARAARRAAAKAASAAKPKAPKELQLELL